MGGVGGGRRTGSFDACTATRGDALYEEHTDEATTCGGPKEPGKRTSETHKVTARPVTLIHLDLPNKGTVVSASANVAEPTARARPPHHGKTKLQREEKRRAHLARRHVEDEYLTREGNVEGVRENRRVG